MKKLLVSILTVLMLFTLVGCRESEMVNYNLKKDADYFNVRRRVTAINTWTGDVLFSVEGYISISSDSDGDLNVTIKTGENEYRLFYAHLSSNVTYTSEQLDTSEVSGYAYEIVWFPTVEQIKHGLVDIVDRDGNNIIDGDSE